MLDIDSLNPQQRTAVETTDGPVLVLAGAGSGKTRVLTYRIAYILATGLAGPFNILAMTFTNKAAGEMKERIASLVSSHPEIEQKFSYKEGIFWIGTFHSICVKILKRYGDRVGLGRTFTIYDPSDQQTAIKRAMEKLNIPTKEFNPRTIHNYISSAKNDLIDHETYSIHAQGYMQEVVSQVYPEYQAILKENNAVDFDDLIMLTIRLLREHSDVLETLQEQFKYILVDEYQDTNHAQYILVNMLADKYRNLCVVGDDDQSIYSFRGATIKNILNFEKDYSDAAVIKLEQNYRSTKTILEAAYDVINKNKGRKDKKLWTDNSEGETITLYEAGNEREEASWITEQIERIDNTANLSNIAILYRTNAQSRNLEEALINVGIPYKIIGGTRFYERREIKDVLAYLRLLYNRQDSTSLERVINVPKRGIGTKTFLSLVGAAETMRQGPIEFLLSSYAKPHPKIETFSRLLQKLVHASESMRIIDLLNYILSETKYIESLQDGTLENESRIENIKELISVAAKFDALEPKEGLEAFLDEVSLLEGSAETAKESSEQVTLMTIHASKGLEFQYVFVVGMEENLFPHSNSIYSEKEIEEERRLAYVAITRAKEKLYLTHARSRIYFGNIQTNPVSRFVEDISPDFVEYLGVSQDTRSATFTNDDWYSKSERSSYKQEHGLEVGDRVKHEYFGVGSVKYFDDEIIEVDFGSVHGVKELMLEYARLQKM